MPAGKYNIVVEQGADFSVQLVIKDEGVPRDLSLYSARAQIRATKSSAAALATFTCTITDAVNGVLQMEMTNAVTKLLTPGEYYYDLELYTASDAYVVRLLEGEVRITAEITK